MQVIYDDKNDMLYLQFDDKKQDLTNERINDSIVLDIGADNKIVGMEILDASLNLDLNHLLPIQYQNLNYKKIA